MTNYELLCELQHEAFETVASTYAEWTAYEINGEVNATKKRLYMIQITKYTDRAYQLGKFIDSMR